MSSELRQAKVRADGRGSPPWNSRPDAASRSAGAWFRLAGGWRPLSRCSNRLFRRRKLADLMTNSHARQVGPDDEGSGAVASEVRLQAEGLLRVGRQLVTEVGMGDGDEALGPLAEALSEQLSYAVFGHDRAYVGAGRGDPSPFLERDGDA